MFKKYIFFGFLLSLLYQLILSLLPFLEHFPQRSKTFSGSLKFFHSKILRLFLVAFASSRPKGDPCEEDLPDLFGDPNPIVVLQLIKVGFMFFFAFSNALNISSKLCPSISIVSQPQDLNLSI